MLSTTNIPGWYVENLSYLPGCTSCDTSAILQVCSTPATQWTKIWIAEYSGPACPSSLYFLTALYTLAFSSCPPAFLPPPPVKDNSQTTVQKKKRQFHKIWILLRIWGWKQKQKSSKGSPTAGLNLPASRNTCQVGSPLILQGGSAVCSLSVLFFYYHKLQGASASRAAGHRGVTRWMCESADIWTQRECVGAWGR